MLTVRDHMILYHAARWPRPSRASEAHRWDVLGLTSVGYYARLDWLIDQPAAIAYQPDVCSRLARLREARQAARRRNAS